MVSRVISQPVVPQSEGMTANNSKDHQVKIAISEKYQCLPRLFCCQNALQIPMFREVILWNEIHAQNRTGNICH